MVPLISTSSPFEARVLAARLGAAGILWEFRGGGVDATYPMGPTEVLVDAEHAEEARELLLADEVEAALTGDRTERWRPVQRWSVLLVLVGLAAFVVARILSLG